MSAIVGSLVRIGHEASIEWEENSQRCIDSGPSCWEEYQCEDSFCNVPGVIAGPDESGNAGAVWLKAERLGSDQRAAWTWSSEYGLRGTRWHLSVHYQLPMESSADDAKLLCVSASSDECKDGMQSSGWTFSARFGSNVFTIYYGSDQEPISRDEFVDNYATVFEDYILQNLVQD